MCPFGKKYDMMLYVGNDALEKKDVNFENNFLFENKQLNFFNHFS